MSWRKRDHSTRQLILTLSAVLCVHGCGSDFNRVEPAQKAGVPEDSYENGDASGTKDDGDGAFSDNDGGDDFEELVDDGQSLDEILQECGDNLDLEDKNAVVYEQSLTSLELVERGTLLLFDYEVRVVGHLDISSTIEVSANETDFDVAATPALAQSFAEQEVAKRAGQSKTYALPKDQRGELFKEVESWNGVVCSIQPTYRVQNATGEDNSVIEFDPPIPTSISPKGDASRFQEELAEGRIFEKVQATVIESQDATLTPGTTLNGSVRIREIAPTLNHTLDSGEVFTLEADIAFEITTDFGGPILTASLGLRPKTQYYIDHSSRRFAAIVTSLEDGETPDVVWIAD